MTAGETWESCLEEIRQLPAAKKYGDAVTVSMYDYDRPSYTGLVYPIECYFPTWVIPKDHKVTKSEIARQLEISRPTVDRLIKEMETGHKGKS